MLIFFFNIGAIFFHVSEVGFSPHFWTMVWNLANAGFSGPKVSQNFAFLEVGQK
jgi:hypothetical protein